MDKYIEIALKEAKKCKKTNDVPVGAVIVANNKIIAKSHNTKEKTKTVTRHAEINVVEKACKKRKNWYLTDCTLYTTLEPCNMCMEVIKNARIPKVVYIAKKQKKENLKTPNFEQQKNVENYEEILKNFFKKQRK